MTVEELIGDRNLTPNQTHEMRQAYYENPEGFERICKSTQRANNPAAALLSVIRKGKHRAEDAVAAPVDLDEVVALAVRSYNARVAKYPPIDEAGWREEDAITYAVDTVQRQHSRYGSDDLERALRIRIGRPWSVSQDPALHAPGGSPPELLDNILRKVGRIGAMPDSKSEAQMLAERLKAKGLVEPDRPDPTPPQDLVQRLLATLGAPA